MDNHNDQPRHHDPAPEPDQPTTAPTFTRTDLLISIVGILVIAGFLLLLFKISL